MPQSLDVYREWLGVAESQRPLNYYQLLRLKSFEDDAALIRAHYRKLNAHVRKFATGEFATQSQQLLNELAKAMLCLTDSVRKGEYDASLGRADNQGARRRSVEELLILRKVCEREQLEKARRFADAVGIDVADALVQQKVAKPEIVAQIVAESLGLPYVELADVGIDETLVSRVPAVLARQNSCVPIMVADGVLIMASPRPLNPAVEEDLRLRLELPVRTVLCTPASVNAAMQQHFPQQRAAAELAAGSGSGSGSGSHTIMASRATPAAATESASAAAGSGSAKGGYQTALIAFNFTFLAIMIFNTTLRSMFFTTFGANKGFVASLTTAIPVAAIVGVTVWLLGRRKT